MKECDWWFNNYDIKIQIRWLNQWPRKEMDWIKFLTMDNAVLYISYDGILEPLGQSQVLSYLEKLSNKRPIYLISFEKSSDKKNTHLYNEINSRIKNSNIYWRPLTYHKRPTFMATLLDISHATILGLWLTIKYRIKIVHARSYVASVSALIIKKILGVYYIFDMRGFWADERVDGGIWSKESNLYRISKWFEKLFLLNSDVVVSLTRKSVEEMNSFNYLQDIPPRFEVITTCANLDIFKPRNIEKKANNFTVGYVGSVGVWYLFEEALEYFKLIKEVVPYAKLHVINKGDHDYINRYLDKANIDKNSVILEEVDHTNIAYAMQSMDVSVFVIKPLYSKISSMPTKLGELLGCGVPCICNSGIGDVDYIVKNNRVGLILDNNLGDNEKRDSIFYFLESLDTPGIKERCRKTAIKYFSLGDGVNAYNNIYKSIK